MQRTVNTSPRLQVAWDAIPIPSRVRCRLPEAAPSQASALAQRGVDSVRDTAQQLRERALRASDGTVNYIRDEPVKSMLIAAATGAGLMALLSLLTRSSNR